MSERGNWFLGLRVEAPELRVRDAPEAVRVFVPEDWHLTVIFLGACGSALAHEVFEAIEDFAFPGFDAQLGEVVPMGNPRRYSALSALLSEGRDEVEAWMQEARQRAEAALLASADPQAKSVRLDRRPVKAHLTFARPQRKASDAQREAALQWGCSLPTPGVAVRLPSLALYAWSEDRAQRLFQIVRERSG